jgi:pimeloyl-ACP methyl ester carboxylesterase
LTTIRGAGHWVHAEAPDDTIALLKRYLDRWMKKCKSTIR